MTFSSSSSSPSPSSTSPQWFSNLFLGGDKYDNDGKGDDGDDDEDDGERREGLIESLLSPVNDFPRGLSTFLKGL